MASKLNCMSIEELKTELRTYGAKVSGRKQDLCDRLQFYRSNKVAIPLESEYKMTLPDNNKYKDVHSGMIKEFPKLNMTRLEEYLQQFNKPLDTGKIMDFYKQRFLRFLRVAQGPNNGSIFLTAVVWAEMKKSVSYKVDIFLEGSGVIGEAQCECGAGQGPAAHCKHVCTVVYGTVCFIEEEKILTEVTCTQTLQSFHHAKPHKGSPLNLSGISLPRKRMKTDIQPNGDIRYDPRLRDCDKNRENYNSELKSLCVNYQANFGGSMPVMQLVPPANLHGVVVDHDYLKYDAAYQFLLEEKLISIDDEDVRSIEIYTRGQCQSKKWKRVRQVRLTASNFGRIAKGTSRQDKIKLALNLLSSSELKTTAVLHGVKHEAVAVNEYEKLCQRKTSACGLFISITNPVLGATPDRVVDNTLIVEVKCPYSARNQLITPQTVPYLILNSTGNLELKRNHDYYYQVQGQLYCSGRLFCDFVVYTTKDIKIIRIESNAEFIQGMVEKLLDFHSNFHKNALISKFVYKDFYNYSF